MQLETAAGVTVLRSMRAADNLETRANIEIGRQVHVDWYHSHNHLGYHLARRF